MEVDQGRRRNAWSLETRADLGLWEKLYSSKGRIKSSQHCSHMAALWGGAQLFSQKGVNGMDPARLQGCKLTTDERLRKESRFLKVTNIGGCEEDMVSKKT